MGLDVKQGAMTKHLCLTTWDENRIRTTLIPFVLSRESVDAQHVVVHHISSIASVLKVHSV